MLDQLEQFTKAHQGKHIEVEQNVNKCGRKSFKINFDEIGWNHILAPKEVKLLKPDLNCTSSISIVRSSIFTARAHVTQSLLDQEYLPHQPHLFFM